MSPGGVSLTRPITAGVVAALVGFTSTFAVVLAGLAAMGATPAQAASGLLTVCVVQGVGMMVLSRRYRMPIVLAWSTPGAALLAGTAAPAGGWPVAVGAFVVTGVLIVVTGLWERLGRIIAAIPAEIAQAMLAGVLVSICTAPARAVASSPGLVVPVLVVWLVLQRYRPRWAVPVAFLTAALGAAVDVAVAGRPLHGLVPRLEFTVPHWSWQAAIGIALPLYVVTMAAQNIPGVAVHGSFGYRVPWRAAMTVTGLGTVAGAASGGHVVNLAAISAALAAAPPAHPDPRRRWTAACTTGATYLALALASAALVALVAAAPPGVLESVAGLALLGTLASALTAAFAPSRPAGTDPAGPTPAAHTSPLAAAATLVISASGVTLLGIGDAFWALLAGLAIRWALPPQRD
ncbi:benzoate/H(+) symporter BenE family transporter [Nocardia stercoris]|uniref:benzoate/H(+) symporter BenE family transporter n=1 Tax=Nocardia stercoris TaxID=2483361 RepID=UPI001F1EB3F1|nr:benzoate/H(+) symporter BenE family transporter [Nocardia stercoris]